MTTPDRSPSQHPRRWLRWVPAVLLLLAVAGRWHFSDETLEPADDLLPLRTRAAAIPDAENGWVQWREVCRGLPQMPKGEADRIWKVMSLELLPDPARDDALVLSEEALQRVEAALTMPEWHTGKATGREVFDAISAFVTSVRAGILRALRSGDVEEVIQMTELQVRFPRRLVSDGTGIDDRVLAALVRSDLPWILPQIDFTDSQLERMSALLAGDAITLAEAQDAWRQEHHRFRDEILSGQIRPGPSEMAARSPGFLYQTNATANHAAQATRAHIAGTMQGAYQPPVDGCFCHHYQNLTGWTSWLNSNRTGAMVVGDYSTPGYEAWVRRIVARKRCLRVLVALHRYWKATGTVPDRLSDLVPRYLPEVPADPFDQEPLRWDKAARVIFSIGQGMITPPETPVFTRLAKQQTRWLPMAHPYHPAIRFRPPGEGPDLPAK